MAYINQPKLLCHYTEAMERSPTDGVDDSTRDFPLTAQYRIPFQISVCYFPTALVTSKGYHMTSITDTHDIRMVRQLEGIQRITMDKEM
jgi:hypothetical protein